MKVLESTPVGVTLCLSMHELAVINNCINETLECLIPSEFPARVGADRQEAESLLRQIGKLLPDPPSFGAVPQQLHDHLDEVRGTRAHILCPRCMGQGDVVEAFVRATGERIFICYACRRVWESRGEIKSDTGEPFKAFMLIRGLPDQWTELSIGGS